jgi:hypothetical protein
VLIKEKEKEKKRLDKGVTESIIEVKEKVINVHDLSG